MRGQLSSPAQMKFTGDFADETTESGRKSAFTNCCRTKGMQRTEHMLHLVKKVVH